MVCHVIAEAAANTLRNSGDLEVLVSELENSKTSNDSDDCDEDYDNDEIKLWMNRKAVYVHKAI